MDYILATKFQTKEKEEEEEGTKNEYSEFDFFSVCNIFSIIKIHDLHIYLFCGHGCLWIPSRTYCSSSFAQFVRSQRSLGALNLFIS